jgi:hypothetical protein
MHSRDFVPVLLIGLVAAGCGTLRESEAPAVGPPSVEEALGWLQEDTEMVLFANGPLRFPPKRPKDALSYDPRHLALVLLSNLDGADALEGTTIEMALIGAREFRHPSSIGTSLFRGCTIVALAPGSGDAAAEWFERCRRAADDSTRIAGTDVAVIHERWEGDDVTLWAAHPRRDLVAIATDQEFLEEALERIGGARRPRALNPSLPLWEHVDTAAPLWAVRTFPRDRVGKDPTSLIGKNFTGYRDEGTIGLIFRWHEGESLPLRFVVRSLTERPLEGNAEFCVNLREFGASIESPSPGLVEISLDPEGDGIFIFMAFLGFPILL